MRSAAPRVAAVVAVVALAVTLLGSCGRGGAPSANDGGAGGGRGQPAGWDREVAIAPAVDLDPDPHVLEVKLDAAVTMREIVPGTMTPVWSYNGQVPGPTLHAAAGDRVIVHFTNHLPDSTTVHWHGIRLPAAMDGTPSVQPPIESGASFDYQFVVPDAGLYWYHPHIRSNVQLGDGLYGAIIVDDPTDQRDFGDEVLLVLSDMALRDDGSFPPPDPNDSLASIWGREGTTLLVGGKPDATVQARRGRRQRWRLLNAATSRYFMLDMAGHSFTRIGGDRGLIQRPVNSDTIILTPGQRADVVVVPDAPVGTEVPVRWLAFDRGFGTAVNRPPLQVFKVKVTADADGTTPAALPDPLQTIDPLDLTGNTPQYVSLTAVGAGYGVNGEPFDFATDMGVNLHATVGGTDLWTVANQSDFDHPFHLHGFFFQVLENDTLEPKLPLEWRDTVNVPQWSDVTFAVKYDDRPGTWMFHCHILDHAELGMMGMLEVAR